MIFTPKGFYVDLKAWQLLPNPRYAENPPDDWEDCGCCDGCHPPGYTGDCRSDINRWPSEKCVAALTAPTPTKRLSWRTKKDQFFQSAGCGQAHVIRYIGNCESCGRSVYSHGCAGDRPCGDQVEDSPDPRGAIPAAHCMNRYHASEYGMAGRDVITCAACADDGDKYRGIIAAAKSTGTWKEAATTLPKSLHIEGRRWFQRTYGNTYHSARIFIDGKEKYNTGRHYGYGEQFLQTALELLRQKGEIPAQEFHSNGAPKHAGSLYLRETLGGTYSVIDVARERDL